jgi:hypothetical protein
MMSTPDPASFADLCGSLPDHHAEIVTAHKGRPTVSTQDERNGAGRPAVDTGLAEGPRKYGGAV